MSSPTSWIRSPSRSVVSLPAVPVVLGDAVLDRDDREAVDQAREEVGHLRRRRLAALEAVDAVGEELARRRVERDRDAVAVARPLDRVEDRLDRRLARRQVGREAALVADRGREPLRPSAPSAARGRSRRRSAAPPANDVGPDRDDHELLQVDRVRGVHAAVDDVHHRHRQRRRALAAEIAVERLRRPRPPRPSRPRARRARIAFAPRRPLFGVPSSSTSVRSSASWSRASRPRTASAISPFTCATAFVTALPP